MISEFQHKKQISVNKTEGESVALLQGRVSNLFEIRHFGLKIINWVCIIGLKCIIYIDISSDSQT